MPTTIISKIGLLGAPYRDYTSIQAWEDACPVNLVTADQVWKGEGYNDGELVANAIVNIAGTTTDATHYLWLSAASGHSYNDNGSKLTNRFAYVPANGVAFRSTYGYSYVIDNEVSYTKIDGWQFKGTNGTGGLFASSSINYFKITNCIVQSNNASLVLRLTSSTQSATNCLLICSSSTSGVRLEGASKISNCTVVRPSNFAILGNAIETAYGAAPVKNCMVFGFANLTGTYTADGHNITDLANAPGTIGSLTSKVYANQFVQSSAANGLEDFRIKAGSDAIGAGIQDTIVNNDVDSVGTPRVYAAQTIGAWEYTVVPPIRRLPWVPGSGQFTKQPQSRSHVDWQNPLTKDLEFAYIPGFLADAAGKQPVGTLTIKTVVRGGSLALTGAQGNGLTVGSGSLLSGNNNVTILAIAAVTADNVALYSERAPSGSDIFKLECFNGGTQFTYRDDSSVLLQLDTGNASATAGNTRLFAATRDGILHTSYCYPVGGISGVGLTNQGTFGNVNTAHTNAGIVRSIGYDTGDLFQPVVGSIDLVVGWKRTLSSAEIESIRKNPWQLFKSLKRAFFTRAPATPSRGVISNKPLVRTTQPQQVPRIDWNDPLCVGLALASTGNHTYDAVSGTKLNRAMGNGSVTDVTIPAGVSVNFFGAASSNAARQLAQNGDITVVFLGDPTTALVQGVSSSGNVFSQSGPNGSLWVGANTDDYNGRVSGQLTLGLLQTSVNRSSVQAAGATDGTMSCYLIKKSAGSGAVYKNGNKLTTITTGTLAGSPTTASDTFMVGGDSTNSTAGFNANLVLVLVFNRALTNAECVSITNNPWQVFK